MTCDRVAGVALAMGIRAGRHLTALLVSEGHIPAPIWRLSSRKPMQLPGIEDDRMG